MLYSCVTLRFTIGLALIPVIMYCILESIAAIERVSVKPIILLAKVVVFNTSY